MKTVSWRIITTSITMIAVYFIEKDISIAIGAGLIINIIKAFLYYGHERIWESIRWGRHHT